MILENFRYPLQVSRQLIRPYNLTRKLMGNPYSNLHRKVSKCQVSPFQLLDEWVAQGHLFGCAALVKSGCCGGVRCNLAVCFTSSWTW